MPNIQTRIEKKRGCGYRKPGGMYLVGPSNFTACCKLPFFLDCCPCCGNGIKPARGFTWINTDIFQNSQRCYKIQPCIIDGPGRKIGLMWVGGSYYPTVTKFTNEALAMGISKRIAQVPKDFVPGQTFIALAHHTNREIFMVFCPQAIEYVVTGQETDEQLERLEKRGITLVKVEHEGEQINLSL